MTQAKLKPHVFSQTKSAKYMRKYREKHPEYRKKAYENSRKKWIDLVNFLGSKCVKCGFSDMRALQLDHIHDDGAKQRHEFNGAVRMYNFYIKNPKITKRTLQVLCANCNTIKRINKCSRGSKC
jgi:hypothetical protein